MLLSERKILSRYLFAVGAALFACLVSYAQSRDYLKIARVEESGGMVQVSANSPRPLAQALCAIANRYQWMVDYEDPRYQSKFDLIDVTNPNWRALHPEARPSMIPSGGAFEFKYEETLAVTADGERQVLEALVAAYNKTDNPGKFEVRELSVESPQGGTSRKRYAIIGVSIKDDQGKLQPTPPLLDTLITLPVEERSADRTIRLIGEEVFAKQRVKILGTGVANNALIQSKVTVGGTNMTARSLLLETLTQIKSPAMGWSAKYDSGTPMYVLNVGSHCGD